VKAVCCLLGVTVKSDIAESPGGAREFCRAISLGTALLLAFCCCSASLKGGALSLSGPGCGTNDRSGLPLGRSA